MQLVGVVIVGQCDWVVVKMPLWVFARSFFVLLVPRADTSFLQRPRGDMRSVSVVALWGQCGCGPSVFSWIMGDGYDEFFSDVGGDVDMREEDDVDEGLCSCVTLTGIFD